MNILLVSANYAPEIGSSAQIFQDLADGFLHAGHRIHIITSYPRDYTRSKEEISEEIPHDREENGVFVHRIKHPSNRDSLILRGLEYYYLPLCYYREYKRIRNTYNIRFDACIFHIPPLSLYYLARMIKRYDGTPTIFNMQDYHPQELTDVSFLTNPVMIAVLKHLEKQAYKNADYLAVNSTGGVSYVVERGGDVAKVSAIFNPVSIDKITDDGILGNYKQKERIENKFLVTYAGILSPFQGIDAILDVAKALSSVKEIIIYIVGNGMERTHLQKRIADEKIDNVVLRDFLPRNEYLNLLKSSDVALIALDKRMKAPCLPGKTVNILGLGKPALAIVSPESETARVITNAKCGIVSKPEDAAENIRKLYQNPHECETYGENGKIFLMQNMESGVVVKKYEEIIRQLRK